MIAEAQDPPANRNDGEVEGATVVRQLRLAGVLGVERCFSIRRSSLPKP